MNRQPLFFISFLFTTVFVVTFFSQVFSQQLSTSLSLILENSFSASVSLESGNLLFSSGYYFVSSPVAPLAVKSTDATILYYTGSVVSGQKISGKKQYSINTTVLLSSGDGLKSVGGYFLKEAEILEVVPFDIFVDTQPPTIPILVKPSPGEVVEGSGTIDFSWTQAVDTGVAGVMYTALFFIDVSSGIPDLVYQTSYTGITLSSNLLPSGSLSWYVIAKDALGWSSSSLLGMFSNGPVTTSPFSERGGGAGVFLVIDNCPLGDFSSSLYDRICTSFSDVSTGSVSTGSVSTGSVSTGSVSTGSVSTGSVDIKKSKPLEFTRTIIVITDYAVLSDGLTGESVEYVPYEELYKLLGDIWSEEEVVDKVTDYSSEGRDKDLVVFYTYCCLYQYRYHIASYKHRFSIFLDRWRKKVL